MLNKESKVSIPVGDIEKGSSAKHIVYIRAHKIGDRNITIRVYALYFLYKSIRSIVILLEFDILLSFIILQAEYSRLEQIKGSKELTYSLTVKKPFEVATQFFTTFFEPLKKGFINERLLIMPHITCVSPWPIKILSTSIEVVCPQNLCI